MAKENKRQFITWSKMCCNGHASMKHEEQVTHIFQKENFSCQPQKKKFTSEQPSMRVFYCAAILNSTSAVSVFKRGQRKNFLEEECVDLLVNSSCINNNIYIVYTVFDVSDFAL